MNFEDIKKGRRHLARALIQYAEMLREQIDGLTHTFYSGVGRQAWRRTSSVNEKAAEKRGLCGKLGTMRVLGIDCGTECTGYGVVEIDSRDNLCCIAFGGIKLSRSVPLPQRLATIFDDLTAAIDEHRPDQVAIEDVFYAVNVKSALKLGQVRGVAMLAAAAKGLEVAEYAPLSIKSAVVGYGKAEKDQVGLMVSRLLRLDEIPKPADAADALAIAICHLHTMATLQKQAVSR